MSFLFAGYFPKKIAPGNDWLQAPHVTAIWSVSNCISRGPANWIDRWVHNDFWLFDSVELAESVVPTDARGEFTIVAYRIWDRMFDHGEEVALPLIVNVRPGPESSFSSMGFDAVGRLHVDFSCSPLSCNRGVAAFSTNDACLFRTVDDAIAGAKEFSEGKWEPGPYWIVEVLRDPTRAAPHALAAYEASLRGEAPPSTPTLPT